MATYDPKTGRFQGDKGKFVSANSLSMTEKAAAYGRYAGGEILGGVKQGVADIGRGIKESFSPNQRTAQSRNQQSAVGDLPPSIAQTINEQTRLQTSSLLSIDAKLEDVVLSQRTIQQDVSRLVFLVEELKGLSRDRDYSVPEKTKEKEEPAEDNRSLLEKLLEEFGGGDRRRDRGRGRGRTTGRGRRPPIPQKKSGFGLTNFLNPVGIGAGLLGILASNTAEARRENPEGAEQFDRTLRTGGERSQVIQGPEAEREQFKDQPLPERAQRLTPQERTEWLEAVKKTPELKTQFENNPTAWKAAGKPTTVSGDSGVPTRVSGDGVTSTSRSGRGGGRTWMATAELLLQRDRNWESFPYTKEDLKLAAQQLTDRKVPTSSQLSIDTSRLESRAREIAQERKSNTSNLPTESFDTGAGEGGDQLNVAPVTTPALPTESFDTGAGTGGEQLNVTPTTTPVTPSGSTAEKSWEEYLRESNNDPILATQKRNMDRISRRAQADASRTQATAVTTVSPTVSTPIPATTTTPVAPTSVAPTSVAPTPSRPSASDTTTSRTTASERGLREAEKARQGEDVRLNVKSYDIDSKGPLLFKSPSIKFETDKLEFVFREKVERGMAEPPKPAGATPAPAPSGSGEGNVPAAPPPSGAGGPSATPSPSTGGGGAGGAPTGTGGGPTAGGGAGTPSGTQRSSGAAPNSVQDMSIPAQGRGLLNEIARTEGGNLGYNAINYVAARTYGRTFSDFSKHPFQGQRGYTAAGRYQFIWTTWNSVAKEINITDFSPKSQDAGCWHLAKKLYSRYGNLEEDLKNPQKYDLILQVLRGTWHGLKNSNSRTLAEEIRKAGLNTQQQQTSAATPVSASPVTAAPTPSLEGSTAGGGGGGAPVGGGAGSGAGAGASGTPSDATPAAGGGASAESATPGGAEKQESEPDAKPAGGSPAGAAPGQAGQPGQAGAGASRPAGGGGNVRQAQSGIRKLPISDKLNSVLQQAARAAGVDVTVTSGGQPAFPQGPRTGSTRHDLGNAADLDLYAGGRILSDRNPADIELKKKFVAAAAGAGASGIGAGYMGPTKIHVGFGTPAKWGGAPWLNGITPGSGAGATTTPSGGAGGGGTGAAGGGGGGGGAAGGGGGGATPMGGRGIGGGMTPMGGRGGMGGGGMGMDPGAMIGGLLGGMLGGRKFGGIGGMIGGLLGSALTGLMSGQQGSGYVGGAVGGGGGGTPSKGGSTEEALTSAPSPPPKPEFLKGEAITSMLPDSFKNIMTDATTLGTSPDQSAPLFTTLPEFPKMKPITQEGAKVEIPNTPQKDTSERSVADYNNSMSFMAGPPEDFYSSSGFASVTPDPNFYGPGGKSGFSAGRLA